MSLLYGVTLFGISFLLLVAIALILKLRPTIVIDTPRALLAISFAAASLLAAPIAIWWYRFPTAPSWPELLTGIAAMAVFFLIATIAISAALLSFSIYELQRIPAIHQKPRGGPMTIAASILIALLFLPTFTAQDNRTNAPAPLQVVTAPGSHRIALVAVDGLTWDIYRARRDLANAVPSAYAVASLRGGSTTERWASLGTGVKTYLHGVRAVEGVRLSGGRHLLQSVSASDVVLRDVAQSIGLARGEPLPPTVRKRDFVWEIFAARGIPSVAVNWWTTPDAQVGALDSIGQASIFATPAPMSGTAFALHVDAAASQRLLRAIDKDQARFATVYLPALDIVLNRLTIDPSEKLIASVRVLDGVVATVAALRARGFDVIVAGMPGDNQHAEAVVAATLTMRNTTTPFDVAPTLCSLIGFPPSTEMSGRTLLGSEPTRIATYGARTTSAPSSKVNEEYYENLKSLGYIR
jgi:hypothetical protein